MGEARSAKGEGRREEATSVTLLPSPCPYCFPGTSRAQLRALDDIVDVRSHPSLFHNDPSSEIYDLADLTPQCGRRGDPLKLFLSWSYHGTTGLSSLVRLSFSRASLLLDLVKSSPHLSLASPDPLPCLQVCFYFAPQGALADDETNTRRTKEIVGRLVGRGFMVDYAPGPRGYFLRVVIHGNKEEETVRKLVRAVEELGEEGVREEKV
jgi:glutamate decarboxylase